MSSKQTRLDLRILSTQPAGAREDDGDRDAGADAESAAARPTTPAGIPRARFHRLDPSCTKLASLLQESYGIYNRWSNSLTDSMQAQSKFGEDQEPYK